MLSSILSRRRCILASVKFLSRALIALNFEPSMATLPAPSRSSLRHSATQLAADFANGPAVVLTEVGNGLEVGCQLAGQPNDLDVPLAFALQPSARSNAIEIAIDVELQHRGGDGIRAGRRSSAWTRKNPSLSRSRPSTKTSTARTGLSSATFFELCRKQRRLLAPDPFHKSCHRSPRRDFTRKA